MRLIKTEDAVGHVLCHDMTQIIKDQYKDARFRKGHVVTEEDIPVLLSMGKEHLYVWEMTSGMVHENDAAERLLALCGQENMIRSGVKEGKIELKAACDGVFLVDSARLVAVNSQDEVMIATRKGGMAVREGDKLAGMRVIPLIIEEEKLRKAEQAAGDKPLLSLKPYVRKTACIVATGGEVKKGLIKDTFTPVVIDKLKTYGIETLEVVYSGDGVENVRDAVLTMREKKPDMILCTGGMSVDPDDNTPGGIKAAGANIIAYGAPVLPGAMFLLGYFDDVPEDLRRFRALTTGRTVICGRRTFETFPGKKPLKNRRNLILSHDPTLFIPNAEVVHSLPELFAALRPDEDAFVIGGASVYEALLPYCSRILLTETLAELPADRFFPDPSTLSGWKIAKTTEAMQSGGVFFRYIDYVNLAPLTYPQTAAHSEPRSPDAD